MGTFLRRRYGTFLGSYSPDKVYVLSSDYDRTINSANLLLAGLFPPTGNQIWNEDLLWQPIAVHSIPKKMDFFIYAEACGQYLNARKQLEESAEVKSLKEQHRELFEFVEQHSGQPMRTIGEMRDFYETLIVENESNKTFVHSKLEIMNIKVLIKNSGF